MLAAERPPIIRTLVVDDEPLARSALCLMLGAHADIEIVGQCGSGLGALADLPQINPDLVFLDVQMPECDGFDVLERLGSRRRPVIIFVTAFDYYAIRAFEAGALDYLLKPFDTARLDRALTRAREQIDARRASGSKDDRLIFKSGANVVFVRIPEITWVEAADYYSCLHVGTQTHLLRRSLNDLESELDQNVFLRIHRSFIVNQSCVKSFTLNASGDYDVLLIDGTRLNVSRRCRNAVFKRLGLLLDKRR